MLVVVGWWRVLAAATNVARMVERASRVQLTVCCVRSRVSVDPSVSAEGPRGHMGCEVETFVLRRASNQLKHSSLQHIISQSRPHISAPHHHPPTHPSTAPQLRAPPARAVTSHELARVKRQARAAPGSLLNSGRGQYLETVSLRWSGPGGSCSGRGAKSARLKPVYVQVQEQQFSQWPEEAR